VPEYVRVATFEADEAALEMMVADINSHDGPPEGVPAKSIMVGVDRAAGRVRVVVRFGSEDDLRTGSATMDAMNPPDDASVRRISVEEYEIVLEKAAP
jgi:hypothetical protein